MFHIKLYLSIINDLTHIYNWQQQKYIKFYVLFYFPIQELAFISNHLAIINIKLIHCILGSFPS